MKKYKPKIVYKYKPLVTECDNIYLKDILNNNRIYLPNRKDLNDPLEGICDMNFGFAGSMYYRDENKIHTSFESEIDKFRVLAVTRSCTSIPLWAHYASKHSGICLGLRTNKSLSEIRKVNYSKKWVPNHLNHSEIGEAYFYKDRIWQYENEWRLLSDTDEKYLYFDDDELANVILGINMEEANKQMVRELLSRFTSIDIFEAYLDPYDFCIKLHKI